MAHVQQCGTLSDYFFTLPASSFILSSFRKYSKEHPNMTQWCFQAQAALIVRPVDWANIAIHYAQCYHNCRSISWRQPHFTGSHSSLHYLLANFKTAREEAASENGQETSNHAEASGAETVVGRGADIRGNGHAVSNDSEAAAAKRVVGSERRSCTCTSWSTSHWKLKLKAQTETHTKGRTSKSKG